MKKIFLLPILMLSACSSSAPDFGQQLKSYGSTYNQLGDDWLKGKAMVEDGNKLNQEGLQLIEKGNAKITEGNTLIYQGETLKNAAQSKFNTRIPSNYGY